MVSKNYTIQPINSNSYYMINKKGTKYLVENNIRYMGQHNTDPVLEDFNYVGTPTITDILGFPDRLSFESWLAKYASNFTNVSQSQALANFQKNSQMLQNLANIWMSKRCVSIYADPNYIYESLHCGLYVSGEIHKKGHVGKWCIIDKLCKTFDLLGMKNDKLIIADLGAGIGLTTIWMAYFLPNSKVYYTDASPESILLVKEMCKLANISNLHIVNSLDEIKEGYLDVVTGFEFVEHIEDPKRKGVGMPFLGINDALNMLSAKGMFMYSTMWNAEQNNGSTVGHFLKYDFDGQVLTMPAGKSAVRSRKHHRLFVKGMEDRGFTLINGGRKGTLWDFKGHSPYCFVRDKSLFNI
jgi:2-polyprenyl-3-methyl-5-hydroxy-6-metoxy-1,4-benzoquinol methylase